ncbi:MAG: hypothetical protein JW929_03280 [Anaerolineales bacterium]|nr:hypothetical protein [Anaerolineales bacterium]
MNRAASDTRRFERGELWMGREKRGRRSPWAADFSCGPHGLHTAERRVLGARSARLGADDLNDQ